MRRGSPACVVVVALIIMFPGIASSAEGTQTLGWETAQLVSLGSGELDSPRLAVDSKGNMIAVWSQLNETYCSSIWASRYLSRTGWEAAEQIDAGINMPHYQQVAVGGSGNAVAVWSQERSIWSARYVVETGWEAAEQISADLPGDAGAPQIGMDGRGNAVAVWLQHSDTRLAIWSSRHSIGTGWDTAQVIDNGLNHALYPQIAVNDAGAAIAIWFQSDGIRMNLWSNQYDAENGWGAAQLVENSDMGDVFGHQVAIDGSGDAVAVWVQYDGHYDSIWSNRYVAGTGWESAQTIESNPGEARIPPQVAMSSSGAAIAVWSQNDGVLWSQNDRLWSNQYTVGTGWATAHIIDGGMGDAGWPDVAVDDSGNAVVVWGESGTRDISVWSNRYVAATGWGSAQLIDSGQGASSVPQVAVDGRGNALAVWCLNDGIWFNRYVNDSQDPGLQNLTVAVVMISAAAIVILVSFTYINRRRRSGRGDTPPAEKEPPPPKTSS